MSYYLLALGFVFCFLSLIVSIQGNDFDCKTLTQKDWKNSQYSKTLTFDQYMQFCEDTKQSTKIGSLILLLFGLTSSIAGIVIFFKNVRKKGFKKLWNSSCPKCGKKYGWSLIYIPKKEWCTGFNELCKDCFKEFERFYK